jgi:hypothetical protein
MVVPIFIVHDRSAARITFIEITFGLNLAFATYEKFRAYIKDIFDTNLDEYIAQSIASETEKSKIEHQSRINALKNEIKAIGTKHMNEQLELNGFMKILAMVASASCLGVLCFDLVDLCGDQIAFLISPFPLYVLLSMFCFWFYRYKASRIKKQYVDFIKKFESDPPSDIKKGLESLDAQDNYDEDNTEDT